MGFGSAGLVLLFLSAGLPTANAAAAASTLSPYCSNFDIAAGSSSVSLREGVANNVTVTLWTLECEDDTCKTQNTSCSTACTSCTTYDGSPTLTIVGQGVNASAIPGLQCVNTTNQGMGTGHWNTLCTPTNSLAGHSGYTLLLIISDPTTNATLASKSSNVTFVAGDINISKCMGSIENGTNKVYLGYDNSLLIYLMDDWNNTVGSKTGRPGLPIIPFNVEITWNPDDGSKVSLGQPITVDTKGDYGYYEAIIVPLKVGNYLAKITVNTTSILNSPIAFQAVKGKKNSASLLQPFMFGSGVQGFGISLVCMAIVSVMTANLL
ncbi:hypothetical protein AXG93_1842s1120 [Marchantia polymorpha subsp. ruderalis]|uniref:GEX2 N-terminal Ig-like domain-containing protein n=1 Tax=Marchantia polymorpha subsp. ruderalis TaxID=1480154 RepID=A0A176WDS6_MARPO|nr:hypothetical protein AXG93_1842s1120 [Marchantia polymorpha subsp. ruderalis]